MSASIQSGSEVRNGKRSNANRPGEEQKKKIAAATFQVVERLESRMLFNSDVLGYRDSIAGGDNAVDANETILTPANVNSTGFGKLFSVNVDGKVYAQPLYKTNVNITTGANQGVHNVVLVATENDSVYAIDSTSGTVLWQKSFINPSAGVTTVPSADENTTTISPQIGITGTPVIDPATNTLYVVAWTKESIGGNNHYIYRLHAVNISNGSDTSTVMADTITNDGINFTYVSGPTVNGTGDGSVNGKLTFNALTQAQRPGLMLYNGTVYVAFAHLGFNTPYHGWLLGYKASSLALTSVFCDTPNAYGAGIWQSGGSVTVDAQGNIYVISGNGKFDTTLNAQGFPSFSDYGDSVIKLVPDSNSSPTNPNANGWGLKVADYFSPFNSATLDSTDKDLGAGGPVLLPPSLGNYLLTADKSGTIFLVNTTTGQLGKFNSTTDQIAQEQNNALGGNWSTPAVFNNTAYFVGGGTEKGKSFSLTPGGFSTTPTAQTPDTYSYPGASPMISANGTANGIVWLVNYGGGTSELRAYNASNFSQEIYTSSQAANGRDALPSSVHFDTPTIADGQVFVPTGTALVVYGLLNKLHVNAGANQSVTLPAAATLAGSVTEAPLVQGGTLTSTWSMLSGPGNVTFANANSAATTATFSAAGSYVLQLAGSDGTTVIDANTTITVTAAGSYAGTPFPGPGAAAVPGTLDADNFDNGGEGVAYHWQTTTNPGNGNYRPGTGVGIQTNTDNGSTGNGFNVAYTIAGDWAKYSVNVATTGTYSLDLRVAQKAAGGQVHVEVDGTNVTGVVNIPNTGSWSTWQTITVTGIGLTAGQHVVKLGFDTNANDNPGVPNAQFVTNLNWIRFNLTQAGSLGPVVSAGSNQSVNYPFPVTLSGSVTETNPPGALTSSWTTVSGPGTTTFANSASASTTATFSTPGTYVLQLAGSDGSKTNTSQVTITVNPDPGPAVNAGATQTITLPAMASLSGSVTQAPLPPGATLTSTWSVTGGPGTVSFGNANSLSTTASFSASGTYILQLAGSDGITSNASTVIINVNPPAQPGPLVSAGANQTVNFPNPVTLNGSVTENGATLTSTWTQVSGPGTATFTNASSPVTTVNFDQKGAYVLQLAGSDGTFTNTSQVTITINPDPGPGVNAGIPQFINYPNPVTLAGTVVENPLAPSLTLSSTWSTVSGPGTVTFANANSPTSTATFSAPGSYVLKLTGSDTLVTKTSQVTITVNPDPGPTVSAGAAQSVNYPNGVSLAGSVVENPLPPGSTLSSTWSQLSGPGTTTFANVSNAATTATFSQPGSYVLQLSGTDGTTANSSQVTITVNPDPGPTVSAGGNQTITLPNTATLGGSVTESPLPQGLTLSSTWTQVSGPGTASFANANSAATTASFTAAGTYVLKLSGSDGITANTSQVTITVNPVSTYAGTPFPGPSAAVVPGTIQAENFDNGGEGVAYHDLDTANQGGANYRPGAGVDLQTTTDTGGGYQVAYAQAGEWLKYSVNVQTKGTYSLDIRIANRSAGGQMNFEVDGADVTGLVNVPNTGSWTTYQTVTVTGISLSAGPHVVRVLMDTNSSNGFIGNFNWFRFNLTQAAPNGPTVTAGANQSVNYPFPVTLSGSVTETNPPGALTSSWTTVSGPGTVSFASPTSAATTATFSAPGSYVLKLAGSDGTTTNTSQLTITVNPDPGPVVAAGSNQTITLPATASLSGSVTQTPLPPGATLTSTWSQKSGPGTASFGNANSLATTASFSASGTYVLQLSGSDGITANTSTVTITVNPAATPGPVVNAGFNQTINLPNGVSLSGSVTEQGATLTSTWTKTAGPGTVTFANTNNPVTTATFSASGTYTLQLAGNDGTFTNTASVTITVNPDPGPTVSAGSNQTINYPAAANLSGSATETLPSGFSVTSTWSEVSGPGTASFGNVNNVITTATFSLPGSYVLKLLATDSLVSNSATVTITVSDPGPTVNAGSNQTVTLPNSLALNGSVTETSVPPGHSLTSTWTQVSGSGTTTFANANLPGTTASFSAAGTYVLKLTGTDGITSNSSQITVTVTSGAVTPITWNSIAPSPGIRIEAMDASVNGKYYMFGGFNNTGTPTVPLVATTEVDMYDPASNVWTHKTDMPFPLSHAAMAVQGQYVYICGGEEGNPVGTTTVHVWRYDTVGNSFLALPDLPMALGAGGCGIVNNTLYFFGGLIQGFQLSSNGQGWGLNLNNTSAGWSAIANMTHPRNHMAATALNGKIYAIGGQIDRQESSGNQSVVDVYDPATNVWSSVASLPQPIGHESGSTFAVASQNRIVVVAGETNGLVALDTIYDYNPVTNKWLLAGNTPVPRKAPVADIVNGQIIFGTGAPDGSATATSQFWISNVIVLP